VRAIVSAIQQADPAKAWRLASFGVACLAVAWGAIDLRYIGYAFGDSSVYWRAWHGPLYHDVAQLWNNFFIYAPPAALAFWPLAQLPEAVFVVVWAAIGTAVYAWLLAPLPLSTRVPALAAGVLFSLNGNIEWVLALVAVCGFRWPALWLVGLFTKVSPFVGFGWFVIRGEWRSVAWAAGLGVALFAVSVLLLPGAWPAWLGSLGVLASQTEAARTLNPLMPPIPFALRAAMAVGLVWWGARTNRPFVLPFVLLLCQPDWQPWALGFLAALPRLRAPEPIDGARLPREVPAAV